MPSDALPFLFCFGFLFFLVPVIVCIVLAVRLTELRGRVGQLETRLAELTKEFLLRTRPAGAVRPQETAAAAHVPATAVTQPVHPHAPAPAAPHGSPIPLTPERQDWPGQERPAVRATPATPPPQPVQPVHPQQPIHPQPKPVVAPMAAHGTAEQLLGKMSEVRQKEERAPQAPTPAAAAVTPQVPQVVSPPVPVVRTPAVSPVVPHAPAPHAPVVPHSPAFVPAPVVPHASTQTPAISHAPAVPQVAAAKGAGPVAIPASPVAAQTPVKGAVGGGGVPPRRTADGGVGTTPPAKKRSLEFYIITSFIVIGAITLALAAIFLVKMGIEKGVFGPMQRDWASAIAALVLIGVGEWWRRREGFWSQGLIGAGLVAMFAAVFAATAMHHFLLPVHGFVLLGLTTAGAVAMSLQDWSGGAGAGGKAKGGMLIATLGLIGGFLTPILVNSGKDDVPGLFGYLILLHIGLIFATRVRGWTILAAASVVLSSLWLIFWTVFKWHPVAGSHDGTILGMFMLGMVGSLVLSTITQPEKWRGGKSGLAAMTLTWLGVGLGMLSACLLIGKSHYDDFQWAFFAILVAGAFVLARLRPMYEAMAWLASILVLALLTVWGVGVAGLLASFGNLGVEMGAGPDVLQEHLRFQSWLLGFGVATVIAAFACLWKSAVPVRWAVLANGLAVAYVGVAYWLLPSAPRGDEWAYLPLAAAGGLAVLMVPLVLQRAKIVTGEESLTVWGHGILALLLMAAPMGLHGGTLTAAWAGLLPLVALAVWRLKLPGLMVGFLVTAFVVGARALMIGTVFEAGGAGRSLWWNPVVWTYGGTLVAMGLSAWILERCGELNDRWRGVLPGPKALAAMMQVGAAVAAFLLLTLEVRWGFHAGQLDAPSALLVERGTFAVGWLLLAAAVIWMGHQVQRRVLLVCGEVIAILGLVYAIFALVIITNPLWWQGAESVGSVRIFNLLIYVYGLPAALCALVAYVIGKADPTRAVLAKVAGAAGVILLFTMVSLQVRQGYAGERLSPDQAGFSFREIATYSAAWLGLGTVCLAIGRRFKKDVLWKAGNLICTGGALYAIVVVGMLMSPMLHPVNVGATKVWNDLLYAYGVPVLLAALAAWVADARSALIFGPLPAEGDQAFAGAWRLGNAMRVAVMVLLFILVTTEVRQGFQGAVLNASQITFFERNTYPIAWLVLATMLLAGAYGASSPMVRRGGMVIAGIGMGFVVLVDALLLNPLWTGEAIGGVVVFNDLLFAYGLPAALCAGIALLVHRKDAENAGFARGAGIVGLVLLFVLTSLEVRQGYAGAQLGVERAPVSFKEFATYSFAWMGLGVACLAVGRRWALGVVRQAGVVLTGGGLAYAIGVVGVALNPMLQHAWVGQWKVVNWVLYAYGVPVVLAGLAAWVIDARTARIFAARGVEEKLEGWNFGAALRAGLLVMLFILVTTEVRQGFQGGYLDVLQMTFLERGSYPVAWLALAGVLLAGAYEFGSTVARRGGMVIAEIGMGFVLAVNAVALNPLWTGEVVGAQVVWNDLLLAYGVPAALCGGIAWLMFKKDVANAVFARSAGIIGLILLTVLASLDVRQGYAGERLEIARTAVVFTELATYAVVWMGLGAACLAIGKRWSVGMVQKNGAILAVGGLLYAVGVVGILGNPIVHGQWVGTWRIVNAVLYAYGLPALLAALVAWIVDSRAARIFGPWLEENEQMLGDWGVGRVMRMGVVMLLFVLVGMEVRQWFQGDHLNRLAMGFMERGSYGVMWFGLAGVLLPVGYGLKVQAGRRGGLTVAGIALGWSLVICGLVMNPLWTRESVGVVKIVNGLLYAYGVPAAAAGFLGWMLWERRSWVVGAGGRLTERVYAWVAGIASLVLVFVLVTLEVQQFFRGDRMGWGDSPAGSLPGEFVAYSLAWAVLGIVYLVVGIWRKSILLRWASLVMMLITIPKVFLVDMSDLHDMQRVLSFGGLGMSLMGLAFVYMRFVFRKPAELREARETVPVSGVEDPPM